jgi:hypothetical protein
MSAVATTSREAVAIVLVMAALLKFKNPAATEISLGTVTRLSVPVGRMAVRVLAVAELAAAAALFGASSRFFMIPTLILLTGFSLFLQRLRRLAPDVACACLGDFGSADHVVGLVRNAALGLLLLLAIQSDPTGFDGIALAPATQLAILVVLMPEGVSVLRQLAEFGRS